MVDHMSLRIRRAATRAAVAISVAFVLFIPAPVAAGTAAPLVFNAAHDFLVYPNEANPSGPWSYRMKDPDGSRPLLANFDPNREVDGWEAWSGTLGPWILPVVAYNNTGSDYYVDGYPLPAGGLFAHPEATHPVVIRWTSPSAGRIAIQLILIDRDPMCGDGFGWSIGKVRHPVVSGTVPNGGTAAANVARIDVHAGDRIDLKISAGANHNDSCDTTQVGLTIKLLPAPGAATIVNGSFENGAYVDSGAGFMANVTGSTTITGWTVGGGGVDWVDTSWTSEDGSRGIDMDASPSQGTLNQTLATTVNKHYVVSFWMAGNPSSGPCSPGPKKLDVRTPFKTKSYSFDTTGQTFTNMGWTEKFFYFQAHGISTQLTFASMTAGWCGAAIDNVAISQVE